MDADPWQCPVHQHRNRKSGDHGSHNCKDRHRQALADQRLDIQQKCAGEQQQRQHPMQDQPFEIDLSNQIGRPWPQPQRVFAHAHQKQGADDGQEHGPDGGGKLQPARADPAEQGCNRDQNTDELKYRHRARRYYSECTGRPRLSEFDSGAAISQFPHTCTVRGKAAAFGTLKHSMWTRLLVGSAFLSISVLAQAQGTQLWQQSSYESFEAGTPHGVAIRSDGQLESSPVATEVLTTAASACGRSRSTSAAILI